MATVAGETRVQPQASHVDEIQQQFPRLVVAVNRQLHVVYTVLGAEPRQPFVLATDEAVFETALEACGDACIGSDVIQRALDGGAQSGSRIRIALREQLTDPVHGPSLEGNSR